MAVFPSLYRAKAVQVTGNRLQVYVPAVFGELAVTIVTDNPPDSPGMGWVMFEAGNPEFPVWVDITGVPGQKGDTGEAGTPGTVITQRGYKWRTETDASDPGSGRVKVNAAPPSAVTEAYVSVYDVNGQAFIVLASAEIGANFGVYEAQDIGNRALYQIAGPVVNHNDLWYTVPLSNPVVTGFAPLPNMEVFLYLDTGSGTNEVVVGTVSPTDPGLELWVDTTT